MVAQRQGEPERHDARSDGAERPQTGFHLMAHRRLAHCPQQHVRQHQPLDEQGAAREQQALPRPGVVDGQSQ